MVWVATSVSHQLHPTSDLSKPEWVNETIWPKPQFDLRQHLWKFIFTKPKILYSPNNTLTRTFIDELEAVMCQRICLEKTSVEYIAFDSETDLLNEYAKLSNNTSDMVNGLFGLVFQVPDYVQAESDVPNERPAITPEMDHFLNNFQYKIRTTSFSINGFYPEKTNAGPYDSNLYVQSNFTRKSFIETQIFVNEAYLSLLLKRANISTMTDKEAADHARKVIERQEIVKSIFDRMKSFNESFDIPNEQALLDKIENLASLLDEPEPDNGRLLSNPDLVLLNDETKSKDDKMREHAEFIKHILEFLVTDHPLFIQNLRVKRMPYPK